MALMTLSFYSHCLKRTVPMRALLPVDAADIPMDAPAVPLPALYLLHGLYGSENDWFTYTRVALWAREKGMAVFCPAGENSFYTDQEGHGRSYLRFLGEELPAFTRRMFPLSPLREKTFLAGLSMGGYGALNVGLLYPKTFGKAAALSPALRPWSLMTENGQEDACRIRALFGDDPSKWDTLALAKRCGRSAPELWMVCGDEDPLLPLSRDFAREMTEANLPLHFEITPGNHDWNFWDREILRAITWLAEGKTV